VVRRLLLLLCCVLPLPAWGLPGELTPIVDASGKAMRPWLRALERARKRTGQARIAVFGASHTAADLWTGELRRRLQETEGEAGHGFVFPVRWNAGYRHQDAVVESSKGWSVLRYKAGDSLPPVIDGGYCGLVAQSGDPADFAKVSTTHDNSLGRKVDRIEVWLRTGPAGGTLLVDIDGKVERVASRSTTVEPVFHVWRVPDGGHTVTLMPAGDGVVTLYGVVMERSAPGVVLDQLGIPGMRASIVLHWQAEVWHAMMQRRKPDLIVFAYGTNDVGDIDEPIEQYRRTWQQVLTRLRAAAPKAACVLVGPTDRLAAADTGRKQSLPRTPAVIAVQREVAQQFGCGAWNAQAAMGGPGAMEVWQRAGLATKDDVHLTRDGYERLAELFEHALRHPPEVKARKPRR
jgi:lysophospholipase L1-like esterase